MKVATKDIVNTVTQTEMDAGKLSARFDVCLLYTSDAADD